MGLFRKSTKMKARGELKEYRVIGRSIPTDKDRVPPLYQMRIFANDKATAKSRFWYFCSMLRKMKKTLGEIVCCEQVHPQHVQRVQGPHSTWCGYPVLPGYGRSSSCPCFKHSSYASGTCCCQGHASCQHQAVP